MASLIMNLFVHFYSFSISFCLLPFSPPSYLYHCNFNPTWLYMFLLLSPDEVHLKFVKLYCVYFCLYRLKVKQLWETWDLIFSPQKLLIFFHFFYYLWFCSIILFNLNHYLLLMCWMSYTSTVYLLEYGCPSSKCLSQLVFSSLSSCCLCSHIPPSPQHKCKSLLYMCFKGYSWVDQIC